MFVFKTKDKNNVKQIFFSNGSDVFTYYKRKASSGLKNEFRHSNSTVSEKFYLQLGAAL